MPREPTWKDAIIQVLSKSASALHYKEITERIFQDGIKTSSGATPADTVGAQITSSIKHQADNSPFIRVSKGMYTLRDRADLSKATTRLTPDIEGSDEEEEQYALITSFGMYWRREEIEWKASPNILGMQEIGATPVNFYNQLGIYLLYDGREAIYVGRTTDRPLGKRLYEHTIDRMSARWDRFSWFGLLPVSEDGSLGDLPETYSAPKMIPALESILIEAIEPRQNRKRGDDLAAVEYLQKVDPKIEKRKVKAIIEQALK